MRARRTPGEIVALTMMEVFLTFLFLVLTFATIREADSARYDERLRRTEARVAELEKDNSRFEAERQALFKQRDVAREEAAEMRRRYESEFPPKCPQKGRFFLEVLLLGDDQVEVIYQEDSKDGLYRAGDRARMTSAGFRQRFEPLYLKSRKTGCRYSAIMRDTPTVTKGELLRLQELVQRYFYADIR